MQREQGLDADVDQPFELGTVVVQCGLVEAARRRFDASPLDRAAMRPHAKPSQKRGVSLDSIPVVTSHIGSIAPRDPPGLPRKSCPISRAAAAFDLRGRRRTTKPEAVGETTHYREATRPRVGRRRRGFLDVGDCVRDDRSRRAPPLAVERRS